MSQQQQQHLARGQNVIVGVVGRKGSGKSTIVSDRPVALLQRCPRIVLWDAMGEHVWIPNNYSDIDRLEQFLKHNKDEETFAVAFIPPKGLDLAEAFTEFGDIVYSAGNLMLCVEEVPMLCTASYLPPEFDGLVRLGRHRHISMLWTAQRAAEVARRLTAATDWFVLFRSTEPRDLEAIADRCGEETADHVQQLGEHEYIVFDVMARRESSIAQLLAGVQKIVQQDIPAHAGK